MSKGTKGRADARREPVSDEPRALPSLWRAVTVCALLLLIGYTAWAAYKLLHHPAPAASAQALSAEARLAATKADGLIALGKAGLEAGAERLTAAQDRPLDALETALAVAGSNARAGAVVSGSDLLALKGPIETGAWKKAAGLARAHGSGAWAGTVGERFYLASAPVGVKKSQLVLAIDLAPALEGVATTTDDIAMVTGNGLVISHEGSTGGSSLATGFGVDVAALRGLAADETTAGKTADGKSLRIASAGLGSSDLFVLAAQPAPKTIASSRTRFADEMFGLLAPLAGGLLLTLILVRQTRTAAEAKLARANSERTFRMAVEAARCGVWEWRLEEDTLQMSDVTGAMLGWGGGGTARGVDVIGRIASEHQERVRQALRGAAQFGGFDVSFRVQKAGGQASWIDARGQGFEPGPSGFGVIIGVALDVTDERNAELRAQQAERRLSDAIDSVSEAFVLWSREGRLLMCNTNFREFFSLEARILKPGAPKRAVEQVAELAIKRREPSGNGDGVEVELDDGRWLQISERRTAEGGWVMTAADISALKRQETALRQNEEALQDAVHRLEDSSAALAELAEKHQTASASAESASKAKSEFLANMSHELRTPLNAINGFSEMMSREMFGPMGDKRYREYAGDIHASGQHLLALINDILDMSKIEAGKMTMRPEPLDFAEIAGEALRLLRTRAEAAGLTLVSDVPSDLPEVEADFRALKQILLNLMSNAVKFTPRGGRVRIFAQVRPEDGGRILVGVTDTGIGIAEADMDRLARPFEQIESQHSKTQQGTGLGLALTKSLVELHGSTLRIDSAPGSGTTVSFTLAPISETPRVVRTTSVA